MDLFAGKGGVAAACRRLGFRAKEWELRRGSEYDLTRASVVRCVLAEIRSGRVLAVMMAWHPHALVFELAWTVLVFFVLLNIHGESLVICSQKMIGKSSAGQRLLPCSVSRCPFM